MRELQHKQKIKRRLYSTPSLIALVVFIAFVARGTYDVFQKKIESGRELSSLQNKISAMQENVSNLDSGIQSLETPAGIEKEVKEKYNVSADGEHVIILVDHNSTSTEDGSTSQSWIQKLWSDIISAL